MQLREKQPLKSKEMDISNPKRCHRCKSIMVYQKFYGPDEHFWGWRCIWCGEIVDSLILKNRGPVASGQLRR
jgi:hypothetical protein